jgi:hypothetical protein
VGNWTSIDREIQAIPAQNKYDVVRRRKITAVTAITKRALVLYAVDFPPSNPVKGQFGDISINLADKEGFDEVTRELPGPKLDVVLHTPGGSAEATESIVELLRARFDDIRFIVPSMAKSAGTIMAMAGNQIVMDERSELGPTDPQMLLYAGQQLRPAPAQAIKDQFDQAQKDINGDPSRLPGWVPILQAYGPSLLAECDNHIELAKKLVRTWLEQYMFAGEADGPERAEAIASYLANHGNFLSHNRRIGISTLKDQGVKVLDMRDDRPLRDAVWDLHLTTQHTFANTGAYKVFENNQHEALIQHVGVQVQVEPGGPGATPGSPLGPPQQDPRMTRQPKGKRR